MIFLMESKEKSTHQIFMKDQVLSLCMKITIKINNNLN